MNAPRISMLAVVFAIGCAQPTVEFAGAYAPTLDAEDCTWDGAASGTPLLQGSMNTALASGYWVVMKLKVGNNDGSGWREQLLIQEVEFDYACRDTSEACAGFRAPAPAAVRVAAVVPAGGETAVLLPLLTTEASRAIADWATNVPATIVVTTRFRGDYGESAPIEFPIVVYWAVGPLCQPPAITKSPGCRHLFGINGNDRFECEEP